MKELMQSIEMISEAGADDMHINAEHALSDILFTIGFSDQALTILYKHIQIATRMNNQIGIVTWAVRIRMCSLTMEGLMTASPCFANWHR
jgi:hypothetical protein